MLYEQTTLPNENVSALRFPPAKKIRVRKYSDDGKISDKLLWEAFKNGDELAFLNIYNCYAPMLYEYGCKISMDKEMVRDCLQDFFLYLRKNRLGFGVTDSIRFYLCKAFRRRVIDYVKKTNNEFNLSEQFAFSQFPQELSIESIYISKQVKDEQIEKLNKALGALDSKERAVIYYFYYKGLSYEQIAEIFQFSHVSSARRVVYRGIRQLRTFFNFGSLEGGEKKNKYKSFPFVTPAIVND